MRIAILTAHLPPVMGGIEVHCENLAVALARQGHNVVLYGSLEAGQPDSMREEAREPGLLVRRIPTRFRGPFRRLSRFLHLRKALLRDHEAHPFDVIHAHQLYPLGVAGRELAVATGARLVITEHGSILDDHRSHYRRYLLRRAARDSCGIVTASQELAACVVEAGISPSRVRSIPNSIWPVSLDAGAERESLRAGMDVPVEAFVAMTVRRLVPKTGIQYAIRAVPAIVKRVPQFRLVVVGDGPMRGSLEALARELGIEDRVRFLGNIDNSRIPLLMTAADIGLFPSLAEATSIAALEFMSVGIPVVASTVGGLPEIIENEVTGFLFDLGFTRSRYDDPGLPPFVLDRLALVVSKAADWDLRSMGARASQRVRDAYAWPAYVARLERELYRSVA